MCALLAGAHTLCCDYRSLVIGRLIVMQVCGSCEAESSSRWQREAWRLVEEQILLEARITLLKLASRLDEMYAEVLIPHIWS